MVAFILPFQQQLNRGKISISKASIAETHLVNALKAGQSTALEVLYDKYAASLLGIISPIVKSKEVAEDVLQETFIKI